MRRIATILTCIFLLTSCAPGFDQASYMKNFEQKTGLHVDQEGSDAGLLTKTHHGYPLLVQTKMGNVWGRYGARLSASQIAPLFGRIGRFLTGTYESGVGGITGSPFDRALSRAIGQPIAISVILKHGKKNAPALDIVSQTSTVTAERNLPKVGRIGNLLWGETVYGDASLWNSIEGNKALMENLSRYRSYYLMVDQYGVSFLFAGTESDYSGMINEFPSYEDFIVSIMDSLSGIAALL